MTASDPMHIRNLRTPVQEADLGPADRGLHIIQFGVGPMPAPRDHTMVNAFLADHPWVRLQLLATEMASDLEFLRYYKDAKRILINLYAVQNFDGLRHLREDLEFLGLGATQARRISIRPILRFTQLRELFLGKQQTDFEVVGQLTSLEGLTLSRITLPSLDALLPLHRLQRIDVGLGGTTNLSLLPEIGRLRSIELFRIRGLHDLSALGRVSALEYLTLQHLSQIDQLPSFRDCRALRRIHIHLLHSLRDLRPIADAPALEELVLIDMRQLETADLTPLVGHRTLRAVTVTTGSDRRNQAAQALLGLPPVASA